MVVDWGSFEWNLWLLCVQGGAGAGEGGCGGGYAEEGGEEEREEGSVEGFQGEGRECVVAEVDQWGDSGGSVADGGGAVGDNSDSSDGRVGREQDVDSGDVPNDHGEGRVAGAVPREWRECAASGS